MERKGFSLIEVIIVVAIAASIVLVVSNLSGNVNLLNGLLSQELQSKSDIDQTLQIMTSEIRSAGSSQSGGYPIDSATTSSFVFYSDINKDGLTERVRYFLASSTIYKGVTEPTGTPALYPTSTEIVTDAVDHVVIPSSTPLFSYYNAAYTGTQPAMTSTADVSLIRLVAISFYSNADETQQSAAPQYFSALIDIRSLRSN